MSTKKDAAPTGPVGPSAAAQPEPFDLDPAVAESLASGATTRGPLGVRAGVKQIWIEMDDGRWKRLRLPEPVEAAGDDGLTPTRARIVAALKAEPEPINRKTLGQRINRKARGGKFSQDVRFLLESGLIFEGGDLLTDDRKKFSAVT